MCLWQKGSGSNLEKVAQPSSLATPEDIKRGSAVHGLPGQALEIMISSFI